MRMRLPGWILVIYLAIDLANPFIPGAVQFTPDEGLVWAEGTIRAREASGEAAAKARESVPPACVAPSSHEDLVSRLLGPPRRRPHQSVHLRIGAESMRDASAPDSDDH